MLRKLVILVIVLALIGAAAFWIITMPASVSASALPAYTPNLENGKTMFYAGGCASCHATPKQEDKTRLGGGLEIAVRHLLHPEHLARPQRRHRRLERG
jgi:cytochrome c553